MKNTDFSIQSYTQKELATWYRCSVWTLRKWLRQIESDLGPRVGHSYSPRQVRVIVERLGEP